MLAEGYICANINVKDYSLAILRWSNGKRFTVNQRESRAIWTPVEPGNNQTEIVICPEAWRYCKFHRVVRVGTPSKP